MWIIGNIVNNFVRQIFNRRIQSLKYAFVANKIMYGSEGVSFNL